MPQKPDMSEFLVRVVEYKFNLSCVSYPEHKGNSYTHNWTVCGGDMVLPLLLQLCSEEDGFYSKKRCLS